jgi:hypothetical protein
MNRKKLILFFMLAAAVALILVFSGILPMSHTHPKTSSISTLDEQQVIPASYSENTPRPTPTQPPVIYSTVQYDAQGCPVPLINPVEHFACPRDLPDAPVTYRPADPLSPTQAEMDAIPVNFPGLDRNLLVREALKDPCVMEFLASGGGIEGITDQPRPSRGTEDVRWPPTLMGYRRINCTEMLVFFDINPSAGNISRITVDFR